MGKFWPFASGSRLEGEMQCVYCHGDAYGTDEKNRPLCKNHFAWVAKTGTLPLSNATYSSLTFTVSQYGGYSLVSDVLMQQGFDSIDDLIFEDN